MPSRGRLVSPARSLRQDGHFTGRWQPTPGQAVGYTGGDKHVASLGHRPYVVETRDAGGIGSGGRMRVSLHHAWWLQFDTCRPTP